MARADYTAIPKDSNTQQPQQTGAGGHTRQASSVSNDQISPKTCHKRPTRRREEHPRHRNRNGDRKPTRIGDCSLAWAECAMIAKHEQKHIAAATDRRVGTLDKHLPSPTTKFPQNAPPARRQKKKRAPETHKRRSKIDQDLGLFVGMGWVRGDCENRTETRSSRNRQARGNTR